MMIIFCYNEIVTDISCYSSGRHVRLSPFSQREIELERGVWLDSVMFNKCQVSPSA